MSTAASVSKGVFVFKGKKAAANAENYICNGDATRLDIDRFGICNELWENINDKIQIMQCDLNTKIFEDLVTYVAEAQLGFLPGSGCQHGTHVMHEIPTAALVTGVNMPDHALMFTNLMSMLVEQVTPHVAMLRSKDCPNLKSIMAKTVSQFLQNVDLGADDDEDLPEQTGLNTRRITSTMSVLANWYKQITQRVGSPKKRRLSEGVPTTIQFPPIVIVLEDLEGFPAPVLQDFITICSNHLHELPLVLIFGIATTVTAVHRLIPFEVSSLLCMDKFQAPPAAEYLSQVISQVLLTSDIPFKLGPKVFGLLLDLFLYHDFSVLNFIRGVQFALLEHFYGSSVSCLCQPIEDAVKSLGRMSHSQVEDIRRLLSFRKHVEGCKPEEQIALLEDDKHTKKAIGQLLNQLEEYHEFYFPVLRCLHVLVCKLPKYPLGKQIREIYVTNLTCNICEVPEYEEAFALLGALSRNELVEMLTTCMLMLSDMGIPQELQDTGTQLQNYLDKLDNIEELSQTHESCKGDTEDETEELPASPPRKMDMFTLKQKLQILGKKKKKLTVYEVLRTEVLTILNDMFKKYLVSPTSMPLHEVFYYNDAATIRRHINGSPRATIQTALEKPYYYIQDKGCYCEGGAIPATLPDVCIVYKLHLECGRLINLYDWLQAFIMVILSEDGSGDEQKKPDKILQARFIRAVSELQFLGFIKPTKRKTDHVARLTW